MFCIFLAGHAIKKYKNKSTLQAFPIYFYRLICHLLNCYYSVYIAHCGKRVIFRYDSSYGLLGASGCGKTTLLSCIVGRRRLNDGEIWVLGGKPGTKGSGVPGKRVGYMPQEIALYGEFSIKETMMYFGWIFGMETSEINDRLQFLLNFLDLPSQNRLVKNLRSVDSLQKMSDALTISFR